MLTATLLDQPIPTNDPTYMEERIARGIARQTLKVQRANARFKALPLMKQRVAIAQDVIKWLSSGRLAAGSQYVYSPDLRIAEADQVAEGKETTLNGYQCQVCAIGALVVGAAEHGVNHGSLYMAGQLLGATSALNIYAALEGIFSVRELVVIETAFEGNRTPHESRDAYTNATGQLWYTSAEIEAARAFHRPLATDELGYESALINRDARLLAIMQNIIKNEGTFIP
jgi:hypothetical protein